MITEEDNGCDEETKPYEVTFRITGKDKEKLCLSEGQDVKDALLDSLTNTRWTTLDFNIKILETKELKHLDD